MLGVLRRENRGPLAGALGGLSSAAGAAAAVDPSGTTIALSLASAALAALGCKGKDGIPFRKAVKNTRNQLREDLRDEPQTRDQMKAVKTFDKDLLAALDICLPDTVADMNALLTEAQLNAETLAKALLDRLPHAAPFDTDKNRTEFATTVTATWTALSKADLQTCINAAFFEEFAKLNAKVDEVKSDTEEILALLRGQGVGEALPIDLAREIVRNFGERAGHLDAHAIAATLNTKAEEFTALQDRMRALSNDDPAVDVLRSEAADHLGKGKLDAAEAALDRAEALDAAAIEDAEERIKARKSSRAKTLGLKGDTEKLRLNYRAAAEAYAEAARMVDPADDDAVWEWLNEERSVIYLLGLEYGDNAALEQAIDKAAAMTERFPRETHPRLWAPAEGSRATALAQLGAREQGTARLEQAVEAYCAIIDYAEAIEDRERWALHKTNLGNTLSTLGEREIGTDRLNQAVSAHTEALKERTRDRVPLDWAATQNNLGNALAILGERENGSDSIEQAVAAFTEALRERSRDRMPLKWAMTQNNLGNALQRLGERESGTDHLEQAVAALTKALKEWTRDRVPLDWATTQNNLGNALATVGARQSGVDCLEQAVAAYTEALKERTRERVPVDWASTTGNLAHCQRAIAERTEDTALIQRSIDALIEVVAFFEENGIESHAEIMRRNLTKATALRDRLRGEG